jgi:hypothetical protein
MLKEGNRTISVSMLNRKLEGSKNDGSSKVSERFE